MATAHVNTAHGLQRDTIQAAAERRLAKVGQRHTRLRREILEGLRRAASAADDLAGVGVDAWGVDYGLLDERHELIAEPFHYRDERTARGVERVHAMLPPDRLYARTGLQFLPFNTLYQLAAEPETSLDRAATMVLIPVPPPSDMSAGREGSG